MHKVLCCYSCPVAKSCLTLCNPMDYSTWGFPILHHLLEFAQTHIHWVRGAIQPSYPLSPPSPPAFNLSQHQGLFQWVSSSNQVAKVLELQFQHQSFQWIFRVNFLQNWLVWCPCSQGESPAPRFESINSLALKLPYGPALSLTHTCCVEQTAEELSGWQSDSVNLWLPQQAIYPFCASVSSLVKWE